MGPLIFNIYINSILSTNTQGDVIWFPDDMVIFKVDSISYQDRSGIRLQLQSCVFNKLVSVLLIRSYPVPTVVVHIACSPRKQQLQQQFPLPTHIRRCKYFSLRSSYILHESLMFITFKVNSFLWSFFFKERAKLNRS